PTAPLSKPNSTCINSGVWMSTRRVLPGASSTHSASPGWAKNFRSFMTLPRKPPAIDGDDGAMHIVRCRRQKKHRRVPDIGRHAPAPGGDAPQYGGGALGIGAQRLGIVGLDIARRDGVDIDAAPRPFIGEEPCNAQNAAFGGGIAGHPDAA